MKKRILSSLLMGALFVASMSTFTSCKDYDDDINSNKDAISSLQETVTKLQTALDQAKSDATTAHATFATKVALNDTASAIRAAATQAANSAKADAITEAIRQANALVAAGGGTATDLKSLASKVASIDRSLSALSVKESADSAAIMTVVNQKASLSYLNQILGENGSKFTQALSDISNLQKIADKTVEKIDGQDVTGLTNILNALSDQVNKFNDQVNVMTYLINTKLTSMVLMNEFEFGGVPAISVPMLNKYPTLSISDAEVVSTATPTVSVSNVGVAKYQINPSKADLTGMTVSFFGKPATYVQTRSTASVDYIDPVTKTLDKKELTANFANGILAVPFTVNPNSDLATLIGNYKTASSFTLPEVALQLSKNDTTVTSTVYAAVIPSTYSNLILADNAFAAAGQHVDNYSATPAISGHLHGTFADMTPIAIQETHKVAYDSNIDLKTYVETHFNYQLLAGTANSDQKMDDATFKALGLTYKFTPIDYTVGSNKTSESQHISCVDGVCTPVKVDASGNRTTQTADRASIGRTPIIRVTINHGNDILVVGYIKLLITDKASVVKDTEIPFDFTTPIYASCDNDHTASMTWSEVETAIYSKLNMSKTEFETTYNLDGGTTDANQFSYDATAKAWTARATKLGVVSEITNASDPTTNILSWKLTKAEINALYAAGKYDKTTGKTTEALSTTVRFTATNLGSVYVTLNIPAGTIIYPVATMDNSGKISAKWYSANSATAGYDEIHMNVDVPGETGSGDNFSYDLLNAFLNKTVKATLNDTKFTYAPTTTVFNLIAPSTADANGQWTVKGCSGATYTLEVSGGNKIVAVKKGTTVINEDVVVLSGTTLTYQNKAGSSDDAARDILNYVDHSKLGAGETFTAYVGVTTTVNCLDIPVGTFNVRFLRPVNVAGVSGGKGVDAVDGGFDVKVNDLVNFTDWRDAWEDSYYKYYGVKSIVANTADAYTDAAKATRPSTPLTSVTEIQALDKVGAVNIDLTYAAGTGATLSGTTWTIDYGKIHYQNSNSTLKDFFIYVPITVTYDWGYKVNTGYAVIAVGKTKQNGAKRK